MVGLHKGREAHSEELPPNSSSTGTAAIGNTYDPNYRPNQQAKDIAPSTINERRLMTKIDLRLIPVLSILYLLAFLDRTNIANAAVYNLSTELGMARGSNEYNTALTIFFVPYVLFEIPSNILLKKLKPHLWLSLCMFGFGLVTICQGLVKDRGGLYTTRFFLGVTETGMFPGCFYLIGMWYKRSEAQRRFSFFFSSTSLAGAFGGLLAAAISKMDGMRGYSAWRWIFILEGTLTCVISFIFFFIIPDFPENAKFLTAEEKEFMRVKLQADQGKSALDRPIKARDILNTFKDYKIIIGGFMYFGLIVPAYGYAFFAPAIIQTTFNLTALQTQLYSVPPWAAAFVFAMVIAFISDKLRHRYVFSIFPILVALTGFSILLTNAPLNVKYPALFLITCGVYSAMPVIVCWFNMNLGGHHRRSIGSAWQIGFGNIGGIIATYAFLDKDKPKFVPGYAICLAFICFSAINCTVYLVGCMIENRRKDSTTSILTEYEKTEKGDLGPDYRYML